MFIAQAFSNVLHKVQTSNISNFNVNQIHNINAYNEVFKK
jgi:hypothetical protein